MKKVALITGVSGGIGSALTKVFLRNNYYVEGTYNSDSESIERLKTELKKEGFDEFFKVVKADLSTREGIEMVLKDIKSNFSHVDAFISNAGMGLYSLIQDTTFEQWNSVMTVNAGAPSLLASGVLPEMISRQSGSLVFVSSVWGEVGASMETAYSQSKSSLIGLTKALAKEVAPSKIRVNCVLPGVIDTKMNAIFSEEEKQKIIEQIPLSRMGEPNEIADLVYFLCSDKAGYITGQVIKADGGYTL